MAGLTSINLDQPPRWGVPEGQESPREIGRALTAITEWAERVRRRLQKSIPHYHYASATYDPPNLADGAGVTTTVTVTGAALGDAALASFSLDLQGIILGPPYVSAADTVTVRFQNETGGALDLDSGTLKAWTYTPPSVS